MAFVYRCCAMVQLMAWDEVQELIDYGALKESEVKTVWTVSSFLFVQSVLIFKATSTSTFKQLGSSVFLDRPLG